MMKMQFALKDGTAISANVASTLAEALSRDMNDSTWLKDNGICDLPSLIGLIRKTGTSSKLANKSAFYPAGRAETIISDGSAFISILPLSKVSYSLYGTLMSKYGDRRTRSFFCYDCRFDSGSIKKRLSVDMRNASRSNKKIINSIVSSIQRSSVSGEFDDPRYSICTDGSNCYLMFSDYEP